MRNRHAPRLALALLERLLPDSEPLAGDLVEQFNQRPSALWFWVQVLAAVASGWSTRDVEIRPLRLVDLQPAEAVERTRRMKTLSPTVNLSGSPLSGTGGLAVVIFAGLMTIVVPAAWLVLLASALAGVGLGMLMVATRGSQSSREVNCTLLGWR